MNFFDKIVGEHGFLVELRTKNSFNEQLYTDIMNYLSENVSRWKSNGAIPIADAVPMFHLIDELSGGSTVVLQPLIDTFIHKTLIHPQYLDFFMSSLMHFFVVLYCVSRETMV